MSSLSRISLVGDAGRVEIEKEGPGQWRGAGASATPVNPDAVRELLSVMTLLRPSRVAARKEEHGLGAGAAELGLKSASGQETVRFGAATDGQRYRWIGRSEASVSYLVEAHLVLEILAAIERLPSRKLFPSPWKVGESFAFTADGTSVRVDEKQQVSWSDREEASRASERQLASLRDTMRELEFSEGLPSALACQDGARYEFALGSRRTEIYECGMCGEQSMGLRSGAGAGCVQAQEWAELKALVASPIQLVERYVLAHRKAVIAFALKCGPVELEVDPKAVDPERLQEYWRAIDLGATQIRIAPPPPPLCTMKGQGFEVHFGKIGESWLAYSLPADSTAEPILRELHPDVGPLLRADEALFVSRKLISEDPLHATAIGVRQGAKEVQLTRGELLNHWLAEPSIGSELATSQWALGMREAVSRVEAESFVDTKARRRAFGKKVREISIEFVLPIQGQSAHYKLKVEAASPASATETRACRVQVNELPAAWLSEPDCQSLLVPIP